MNARNDVKRPSDQSLDARLVLAAAQLRFAARVDFLVARWLERCATNAEAAQRLFKTDRKPTHEFGMGVSLVVSSPRCDESRGGVGSHQDMERGCPHGSLPYSIADHQC
jgi:hypothetical protein